MDIEEAEKAWNIFSELEKLYEIKSYTEKEYNNWWSFLTTTIKRWDKNGFITPTILREEFTKAVDRSIKQLEKQIEEL
jgi:hypothetical protein